MIKHVRNVAGSLALGATVLFAPATSALAMPAFPSDELLQVGQVGLVNVSVGDVTVLEDVNIAAAVNVAAQVCGTNVNVGVISQAIQKTGEFVCNANQPNEVRITRA
jgi:hypothetical protein